MILSRGAQTNRTVVLGSGRNEWGAGVELWRRLDRARVGRDGCQAFCGLFGQRASQGVGDVVAEFLDCDAKFFFILKLELAEFAPIRELSFADDGQQLTATPERFILKVRNADIEDREDEVATVKLRFALEEKVELEFAVVALDRGGCNDRHKKNRFLHRAPDLQLPQLSVGDRGLVLPNFESAGLSASEELPQLFLDAIPDV